MKKIKRLAAVLLAGIMALALFTACRDSLRRLQRQQPRQPRV